MPPLAHRPVLFRALSEPKSVLAFTLAEWDLLLRQARHAAAVGRLGALLDESGALDGVPAKAREHLEAAGALVQQQHRLMRWEVTRIRRALASIGVDIVLLKGAAYLLASLPPAKGRLFSDVDILVPKSRLPEVEATLLSQGWEFLDIVAYDDRFYRAWSHELPPMKHRDRYIVVDVLLGTPIDQQALERVAARAPAAHLRAAMDFLVTEALAPQSSGEASRKNRMARGLLYLRHHWQRMPPLLLARHLLHKSLSRQHAEA